MNTTITNAISPSNTELRLFLLYIAPHYKKHFNSAFKLGVMGKSGAGKSSFINAFCQQYVCETGAVGGCTREVHKIQVNLGKIPLEIYDFPGIAENEHWDKEYLNLYQSYLDKMDLIFWTIKIDDRAIIEDEKFFSQLNYSLKDKFVFILSKCDHTPPRRQWDYSRFSPSTTQLDIIHRNKFRIITDFSHPAHKIVPIATDYNTHRKQFETYNLNDIFALIIFHISNISLIQSDLDLKISWKITQKEFKFMSAFSELEFKYMKEMFDDTLESLDDLIKRLENQ